MTNILSLDQLRADIEREFAPVKVALSDGTEVTLRNLLRLPKKEREKIVTLLNTLDGFSDANEDTDESELLEQTLGVAHQILHTLSDSAAKGKQLVKELGDDMVLVMKVLEAWMEATQPGEAPTSES